MIKSLNWIITNQCNSRCRHCDIWQNQGTSEISLDSINKILDGHILKESYAKYGTKFDISLGGGEPFLREDLQQIAQAIDLAYPGSLKTISTNALLTRRILLFLKNNPNLNLKLNVSLDGEEKIHDQIRGFNGAFKKTIKTIIMIKRFFPRQKIEIKLTLIPQNYDQILKVYILSLKLGCTFSFKPAENMKNYTNKIQDIPLTFTKKQLCIIRNQAFRLADIMHDKGMYKKARFFQDIPFYLSNKKRPKHCSVLQDHLTIMANGDCFFCLKENCMGNLIKEDIKDIIPANDMSLACKSCMLMCGSYKDYSDDFFEKTTANIETTLNCNLRCPMCTQKELRADNTRDMPFAVFNDIIENNANITHISFVGGEPFLNPDFFRMMQKLDNKGITSEITSNGTLINNHISEKLKDCIGLKKVNISIDGLKKYHDSIRGEGVFDKCINALKLLNQLFQINVCTVLCEDNIDELPQLTQYLIQLGVRNQKIIYGMDLGLEDREKSKKIIPSLIIKGPLFKSQIKNISRLVQLFRELDEITKNKVINISYEPMVLKDYTAKFLDGNIIEEKCVMCKQSSQLRFNNIGKRIICEFIRNDYSKDLCLEIENNLLPICKSCCKLKIKNMNYPTIKNGHSD